MPSVHRFHLLAGIALLLTACSAPAPAASPFRAPASGSPSSASLSSASTGVCEALSALPDIAAAQRAFTNSAHEALHTLAATPGLERTLVARLLEDMERVESDFEQKAGTGKVTADLSTLHGSANAALAALGGEVPGCDR